MFKIIALIFIVAVAGVLAAAALKPADFRVSRTVFITAPAEKVYAQVDDFHKWSAWSPWEKMDPGMSRGFEGPITGVGASYNWKGNDKVGEGRMTVLVAVPNSLLKIKLEFFKPWAATNTAEFDLIPAGPHTELTWSMSGHNNLIARVFCLFMNMDKMVGGDFEKGLKGIKDLAETP